MCNSDVREQMKSLPEAFDTTGAFVEDLLKEVK